MYIYTHKHTHTHTHEKPFETQTPTYWNLIGRNMTSPSPVPSPSSILPPLPFRYLYIPSRNKFGARV